MKILYIDNVVGISGDMFLSALIDIVGKNSFEFIKYLPLNKKIRNNIKIKRVLKNHICSTKIIIPEEKNEIKYSDMIKLIKQNSLDIEIKKNVLSTIDIISKIESKIHNVSVKNFHFHNYNDLIVELFGVFYLIKKLEVEKFYSSSIKLTRGFVDCVHGKFPVPAPATLELSKNMPVEYLNLEAETTTPTGVALLKMLNPEFVFPGMKILKIGYGCGEQNFEIPNILRLFLGEDFEDKKFFTDRIIKLETNIDDLSLAYYEQIVEKLYKIGSYEVNLVNTVNKKLRLGTLLTVIIPHNLLNKATNIIFKYTTTTGIRVQEISRIKLFRKNKVVNTVYGPINVKLVKMPDEKIDLRPEYDDIKLLSEKLNLSMKKVYSKIYYELNNLSEK